MAKDYKSFSSIAKPRFRDMAKSLGYEQITGTAYLKEKNGWYEGFTLQASSYGNDFFFINYGVSASNLWNPFTEPERKKNLGFLISDRFHHGEGQGFPNGSKLEVEKSAKLALLCFQEQAVPWFKQFSSLTDICERYFDICNLDEAKLGRYDIYSVLSCATYGLLLYRDGNYDLSKKWLSEADRLYRNEPDLEDYEIEQLDVIQKVIEEVTCA